MKSLVLLKIPQEMACQAHCLATTRAEAESPKSFLTPVHLPCPEEASWSHLDPAFPPGEQPAWRTPLSVRPALSC